MARRKSGTSPTDDSAPRASLGSLKHLWPFLKPHRLIMIGAFISLVFASGATLGIGQAIRRIVDHGFLSSNGEFIDIYFIALMGIVTVLAVATFGRYYLVSWLGERVVADIRTAVYGHVIKLSPQFFETNKTGEIASRLTTDTALIETVVGSSASIALRNLLMLIGGIGFMVYTSPSLSAWVLAGVPLVVVPIVVFGRKVRRLSRESQDRVAALGAAANEKLSAVETVQAFAQEEAERVSFKGLADDAFAVARRRIQARAWLTALVILCVFGAIDFVLWKGATNVISGATSGGELAAFVFYSILTAGSLGALSEVYGDLQRAAGAGVRIAELLATESPIKVPANPARFPEKISGQIEFNQVTFHYPSRPDTSALESLSLTVKPGETVALVGPSGAGKSTVFQLLLRFYDPQSGVVRVEGVDLAQVDPVDLRSRIAIVPQDTVIFGATAFENIRYGRPDATDDEVWAAARAAAADDFIRALPQGEHSFLGERGTRLSGGQRQRIAIARAILRDAPILLLDEATSALDAESESLVQGALERLMEGRTTIVIAHRLATVLKADRIVVLDGGRVVAEGTHETLSQEDGLYARLAERQFLGA